MDWKALSKKKNILLFVGMILVFTGAFLLFEGQLLGEHTPTNGTVMGIIGILLLAVRNKYK